jgi:hypothetical protein
VMFLLILGVLCSSFLFAAEKQTYVYKTVGELKIEVDVFCPTKPGKYPTVLMFHGERSSQEIAM